MASLSPQKRSQSFNVDRKRKYDSMALSPDESQKGIFILRSPRLTPSKTKSVSPARKKPNLTLRQGANQNNKIFRYLQPKRLLSSFDNPLTKITGPSLTNDGNEDKENNKLDVKVTLMRISEETYREHSFCTSHQSPSKYCCNEKAESVVQVLHGLISEDVKNPCRRLSRPVPICLSVNGCCHHENAERISSYQDTLLCTMVDADLQIMVIHASFQQLSAKKYPSPSIIHSVFNIMKESADQRIIALGSSFLKRTLNLHPPCTARMKKHYLYVLHSPNAQVNVPSKLWSMEPLEFFEKSLTELEEHIEGSLNPKQLKEKLKTPGIRKKELPKRYMDTPSPVKKSNRRKSKIHESNCDLEVKDFIQDDMDCMSEQARKKRLKAKEAIQAMSDNEKSDHVFARFEILVDILEWDLLVWLSRTKNYSQIRDRSVCPLVVLALWRPQADTGYDSAHCRRIIAMYVSAWILKLHPRHIQTLARFIGLIAEVTAASERNSENIFPYVGEGCENLGRKLCDAMRNTQLSDSKAKAVAMIKPEWLRMLLSANLLGVSPTLSSLDINSLLVRKTESGLLLWTLFLEAVLGFYHTKEAMRLLQEASDGGIQEVQSSSEKALTNFRLNYKSLLQEIIAYYTLMQKLDDYGNLSQNMPDLLCQVLAY